MGYFWHFLGLFCWLLLATQEVLQVCADQKFWLLMFDLTTKHILSLCLVRLQTSNIPGQPSNTRPPATRYAFCWTWTEALRVPVCTSLLAQGTAATCFPRAVALKGFAPHFTVQDCTTGWLIGTLRQIVSECRSVGWAVQWLESSQDTAF